MLAASSVKEASVPISD
jgi:hypothetical protein